MLRRGWFKVHSGGEGGWLDGTVRWKMGPIQRSIWIDLLAFCTNSRWPDAGVVASGKNPDGSWDPYPENHLLHIMQVDEQTYRDTLRLLEEQGRIQIDPSGAIVIVNWSKYQDEYCRVLKYRRKAWKPNDNDPVEEVGEQKRAEQSRAAHKGEETALSHQRCDSATPTPLPPPSREGKHMEEGMVGWARPEDFLS